MINPNAFAYFALAAWPTVSAVLFAAKSVQQATIWTILGGYLLLPVGASIKLEHVPAFDKYTITNLAVTVALLAARKIPAPHRRFDLADFLVAIYAICPIVTSYFNTDPIPLGNRIIPGEPLYDGISASVASLIAILPFIVARKVFVFEDSLRLLLMAIAVAGLGYSLLMLFEIRMSPQLHVWIYGYFPHDWTQQYRDEGFRPVVFLGHGLLVAFFCAIAAVAATSFSQTRTQIARVSPNIVATYLFAVLLFCKTLSALIYAAVAVPLIKWIRPQSQLRLAAVLAILVLLYPGLSSIGLVPTTSLIEVAAAFNPERAGSLKVRFDNEESLMARASDRLFFGWGRWGRNRVYDQYGTDTSITDGRWILTIGAFGLVGFIAEFGLLAYPVWRAWRQMHFLKSAEDNAYVPAVALIVALTMVDLIPNGILTPLAFMLAGALAARMDVLHSSVRS